jgi:hypothetical protein
MSRSRLAALAALSSCALVLGSAAPALAEAPPPNLTQKVSITGSKGFKGTYTIERFVREGDRQFAVGTLRGKLRGKRVRREDVRVPATLAPAQGAAQIPPTPGACTILSLTLGPIDLNLLGLRIRTNQIELLIEGIPAPGTPGPAAGGLLGSLLCAITNLLNPAAGTPPAQVTQLLNAALALSPRSA